MQAIEQNVKWGERIKNARKIRPRKTIIVGVPAIGKSTWASKWPKPIAISTEGGLDDIDIPVIVEAKNLVEAWQPIVEYLSHPDEEHGYQTLVIDTIDWLESMIHDVICEKESKDTVSDIPFGCGYDKALVSMRKFMKSLDACIAKGMHVLLVAHSQIVRFEDPVIGAYDRFAPRLHKKTAAALTEWADEVLFANYKTFTVAEDKGFGQERKMGVGDGSRVLYTTERPGHCAKNRLNLPEEMPWDPRDFSHYEQFLVANANSKKAAEAGNGKKPAKK